MSGPGWERWIARIARSVDRRVDDARTRLRPRVPRQVVPYRGFGDARRVYVTGRVLANRHARPVTAEAAWWRNLAHAFQHLESDEVPGVRVNIEVGGGSAGAITDEEGYYRAWLSPSALPHDRLWHHGAVHVEETGITAPVEVLVPTPAAEYGIISDIDDTVIRTDATRLLHMLRRTLLENAFTRLPFPGVAELYGGLHSGASGRAQNPVFYVSSSPWNLYPVLTEFLEHQAVPAGPILLRDWGITESGVLPTRHGEHKLGAIRRILQTFPDLPFILIGDSGQEDPEIYRDVVHEYGARILAVYIRDVTRSPARVGAIRALADQVRAAGSGLLLSDDSLAGARHAAEKGWVRAETVAAVADAVSSGGSRPG